MTLFPSFIPFTACSYIVVPDIANYDTFARYKKATKRVSSKL